MTNNRALRKTPSVKQALQRNQKEKIQSTTNMLVEIFKILMACMLSLFVPQRCGDHVCTLHDNFNSLTPLNYAVLGYNFVTLTIFLVTYGIELHREYWIIDHLDFNEKMDLRPAHFQQILHEYPSIESKLFLLNSRYHRFYKMLYFFVISNFAISAILTCGYYYNGSGTVTGLLTNFLLITTKVKKGYECSAQCVRDKVAISAYMNNYQMFNDIDVALQSQEHHSLVMKIKIEDLEQQQI